MTKSVLLGGLLLAFLGLAWVEAVSAEGLELLDGLGSFIQDSVSVEFVGNWPFGPAYRVLADRDRDIAFLGCGGGVYVIDYGGPVRKLSEAIHTRGIIRDFCYDSGARVLYIAAGIGGLEIWDVADPTLPRRLSTVDFPSPAEGVDVSEPYVYVATEDSTVRVIDVSTPRRAEEIGSTRISYSAEDISYGDDHAYTVGFQGTCVIDVGDPLNPREVGRNSIPGEELRVRGSYAYVASSAGLRVLDLSRPRTPIQVGIAQNIGTLTGGLELVYPVTYVTYYDDSPWFSWAGVATVSVSVPTYPHGSFLSRIEWFTPPLDVSVDGSAPFAACQEQGLWVLHGSPYSLWEGMPDWIGGVWVSGSHAFTGHVNQLRVLDVSSPASPYEVGQCDMPSSAHGIQVVEPYAYVACGWAGLVVLDITDPINPQIVGEWDTPRSYHDIHVQGDFAYVADYMSGFRVHDISDPTYPELVGSCDEASEEVFVVGDRAFATDGYNGLTCIDVTNPADPQVIRQVSTRGYAQGLYVSGRYAYVADDPNGLGIFDVSSVPPVEVAYCGAPRYAKDVWVTGQHAYVTNYRGGLWVIDVSDAQNPSVVGYRQMPSRPREIFATDSYVYVTDLNAGVQIFEVQPVGIVESKTRIQASRLQILGNPVRGDCVKLRLDLGRAEEVVIELYSVAGRRVRSLSLGRLSSGTHDLSLSVEGLPSGVYFLRLKADQATKSNRVVLIG